MTFKKRAWIAIIPLVAFSFSCSKSNFSENPTAPQVQPNLAVTQQPVITQPQVLPTPIQPAVPTPIIQSTPTPLQPITPVQPVAPITGNMTINAILVHNMEHARHVVGKDSYAVLRDGSQRVIAAGPVGLDSAINGKPLGMLGAYPGTQISVALDLLQPGSTSGTGFLSMCPVADRTTFRCVGASTQGSRPIHWENRSVPYAVQGNIVTVNNRAYGNGDDLQFAVSYAHPIAMAATASRSATLVDASSPLILDLDKNGKLDLLSSANPINKSMFDLIGDAKSKITADKIGWIAPQDGLLALDLNGNKTIDSGKELFGEHSFDPAPKKKIRAKNFEHGFAALAIYDDNADKKIDAKDKVFNKLLVWQDKNSDGVSQKGELKSLAESGVKRLYLRSKLVRKSDPRRWNEGNILAFTSQYRAANNRKYLLGDVWFSRQRATATLNKKLKNTLKVPTKIKLQKKGS